MQVSGIVKVDGIIELPETWLGKIEPESITVQLTPIGVSQELFVYGIQYGAKVVIRNGAGGPINAYYTVTANPKELPVVEDDEVDHLRTCDY
tara:strand:- start:1691 stop:1966 length:276 start_codon:yes stop_codon:yes gene_type:complete